MTEIKLEKRFPHIPDEDVTRIFQDGYRKGWENARKKAIPIEWIAKQAIDTDEQGAFTTSYLMLIEKWRKDNGE